jgi:hypothetical protein
MNERTNPGSTLSVITILWSEYVNILDLSPQKITTFNKTPTRAQPTRSWY